ncbi:hypothetical protein GUJ93_ZPchr0009g2320 [Zizania palustris]|uniref:Uncharacterized protein n=1 Tax=Zizania palustris TaxID=103762 RepID=A0A8J5V8B0_ZIZPA|nr:hypothetical protein GUJ93_ZPchr0009g2320 [Zizania palustris]
MNMKTLTQALAKASAVIEKTVNTMVQEVTGSKRALSEARNRAGLSKASEDAFLDLVCVDATRLVRLRHPGVLHVMLG